MWSVIVGSGDQCLACGAPISLAHISHQSLEEHAPPPHRWPCFCTIPSAASLVRGVPPAAMSPSPPALCKCHQDVVLTLPPGCNYSSQFLPIALVTLDLNRGVGGGYLPLLIMSPSLSCFLCGSPLHRTLSLLRVNAFRVVEPKSRVHVSVLLLLGWVGLGLAFWSLISLICVNE